jgi:hypothetical protein
MFTGCALLFHDIETIKPTQRLHDSTTGHESDIHDSLSPNNRITKSPIHESAFHDSKPKALLNV